MEQVKADRRTKRPFSWDIHSIDIDFMRAEPQATPLEGCIGCNPNPDCGCGIVNAARPKKRRAASHSAR